jgi:GT2 family glycosyltransferase
MSEASRVPQLCSVIIPVHNGAATLADQLRGLSQQTYPGKWEVIIVDNNSTDDTVAVAESWRSQLPNLRIVEAAELACAGYARNRGAAAARGDFLAFCDADDVATAGWLKSLAKAAADADLVGGPVDLRSLNSPETCELNGGRVQLWETKAEHGLLVGIGFLPFVTSANAGVWANVFSRLGGWSEEYPGAAGEDVDFSIRAQLAGYQLGFARDAVMAYRLRSGLTPLARQAYGYGNAFAAIYCKFRHAGVPRRRAAQVAQDWWWIVSRAPTVFASRARRGSWIRRFFQNLGQLAGSLRHRVLYP